MTVDVGTGNLTDVKELSPYDADSAPLGSLSANITGTPLNGRAYNGVRFNMTNADQFVTARAAATDLQLPASIFQAAEAGPGGLTAAFSNNGSAFTTMATDVYVSGITFCQSWH